ncbi:hypothetical protein SCHPADRAFT_429792 [Schizopora paradoxa]|uniref:Uncharacterized protein n=1 Tax=Schizopora paradoxa TaxID=27342 RepID=A0A0H2RS64_9AGAM|nr:hypothetical protein SCHPADRAFT_429792 [Schizopora paradoxa]
MPQTRCAKFPVHGVRIVTRRGFEPMDSLKNICHNKMRRPRQRGSPCAIFTSNQRSASLGAGSPTTAPALSSSLNIPHATWLMFLAGHLTQKRSTTRTQLEWGSMFLLRKNTQRAYLKLFVAMEAIRPCRALITIQLSIRGHCRTENSCVKACFRCNLCHA